jgi:hypothetical protein
MMNFDLRRYGVQKVGIVLLIIVMVVFSWLDPIDAQANQQVESGLKRALVTFATARALNGVVSVVQGTELSAQPFGFGLTLSIGQILDPVNDLIEKFSDLMLVASIVFGAQKILLMMGASWWISLAFSVLAFVWCYLYLSGKRLPALLVRALILLVITRFALPVALVGSGLAFDGFLKTSYDQSHAEIQSASNDLVVAKAALGEESTSAVKDVAGESQKTLGFFEGWFGAGKEPGTSGKSEGASTQSKAPESQSMWSKIDPRKQIEKLKQIAEKSTERIIDLMVVFVMQTILLPLFLIWLFVSVLKGSYAPLVSPRN